MKINIANIGTKEWLDFKADITFGLYWSLKEIGFDVSISANELKSNVLNIIIGTDFLAESDSNTLGLLGSNVDYMVFEVEAFDGKTINGRENFNLNNYLAVLSAAKLIVTPYSFNQKSLNKFFPEGKIAYVKWGYHKGLSYPDHERRGLFEYDGIFFGLPKGDRKISLSEIKSDDRLNLKVIVRSEPVMFRDYFLKVSRCGLQLSYGEGEYFINPFRLFLMASLGLRIISDREQDEDGYLDLCEYHSTSDEIKEELLSDRDQGEHIRDILFANSLSKNLRYIF